MIIRTDDGSFNDNQVHRQLPSLLKCFRSFPLCNFHDTSFWALNSFVGVEFSLKKINDQLLFRLVHSLLKSYARKY